MFPLHVEAGKRYLVDAAGKPFFINGDAGWSILVQLTRQEADRYLEDRRRKGFNAILVNLLEHQFSANPPLNAYGDSPFKIAGDFSTPNDDYFTHVDHVIGKAREKGILVLLTPAYVGYAGGNEGWYQEMAASGTTKLRAYGEYLGNRYRSFANILWVDGGDYNVPDKSLVRAVAEGIRSVDSKPHTYHGDRGTAAMQFWGTGEPWLDVNDIYTDDASVVSAAFREYGRASAPFFLIEAIYEGEHGAGAGTVRQQAYQAVLSGASGHVMGTYPVWHFVPGWQQALDSGGATSMTILGRLFQSRTWWALQPDLTGMMLLAGLGSGADRAVMARASNGSFAMAYMPSIRSITIDLSKLAGPKLKATWVDPSDGTSVGVAGSPLPAAGTRTVAPPGNNRSGFGDWVLLLESTP